MKYTQFVQLAKLIESNGYSIKDLIKNPNLLLEQVPPVLTDPLAAAAAPVATAAAPVATTAAATAAPAAVAAPAATAAATAAPAAGTTPVATALSNGVFGAITTKALLFGVMGVGVAAIAAWLLRRQIIKAVWFKKLTNNAKKVGKSIDAILLKNTKDMIAKKDEIIRKGKQIQDALAKNPDANTKQRLEALQAQLTGMSTKWDTDFVAMIDKTVETITEGKTKELKLRIDQVTQLKPGQKMALKTMWDTMMINLKAEGYKNLINLKLVTTQNVFNKIMADLENDKKALKEDQKNKKLELEKTYKTIKNIPIGDVEVKYGQWYLYEKSEASKDLEKANFAGEEKKATAIDGNKYVRFVLDADKLGEGEEQYIGELVEVKKKEDGKYETIDKGTFKDEEQQKKLVANAKITNETKPVDIEKIMKGEPVAKPAAPAKPAVKK